MEDLIIKMRKNQQGKITHVIEKGSCPDHILNELYKLHIDEGTYKRFYGQIDEKGCYIIRACVDSDTLKGPCPVCERWVEYTLNRCDKKIIKLDIVRKYHPSRDKKFSGRELIQKYAVCERIK